jgi:hypothetical protein
MKRIAFLGLLLACLAACATPQRIKEVSHQQADLIREFHKALGELRTKLLVFYDEEIEEFKQDLLRSRMASEEARVSQRVHEAIRKINPERTKDQREGEIKKILDAAANYLAQLPKYYFDEKYCKVWPDLKKDFLREPGEKCDAAHIEDYHGLSAAREEVARRLDRLVMDIGKTRDAHNLVNEFLQIEFRPTREKVDEARRVIERAGKTVEEAEVAWTQFREKKGGTR